MAGVGVAAIGAVLHPFRPVFGEEGLHAALREAAEEGKSTKDLCLHLVERAMEVAGGVREDDITVVVARRTT